MRERTTANWILAALFLLAAMSVTSCDEMFVNDGDSDNGINSRGGYFYTLDNESMNVLMLDQNMVEVGSWPYSDFTSESFIQGITYDGDFLWLSVAGDDDSLYQIDLASGGPVTVVRTLEAPPDGGGTVRDIAWDGTNLWVINSGSDSYHTPPALYQLDPSTGEVLASFNLPSLEPRALCYVGENADVYGAGATVGLYYIDKDEDLVYKFITGRQIFLEAFAAPVGPRGENYVYPTGLFFDGTDFWVVNSSGAADYLFHLDYEGSEIQRVDLPYGSPGAIVWLDRDLTVAKAPVISSVTPSTGGPGTNKTVTIQGSGFQNGDGLAVEFGAGISVDSLRYNGVTSITAYITIDENADIGYRNITVTNPDGQQGVGTGLFAVVENDPSTGYLWVTDYASGILYRYSILTQEFIESYSVTPVSPSGAPQGLAYDGTNLWMSASGTDKRVARFDTTGGALTTLQFFSAPPAGNGTVRDMTFDGTDLWVANNGTTSIYRVSTTDGTILETIPTPGSEVRGVAWADGSLYCNDKDEDAVYVWDPTEETWTSVFSTPIPPNGATSNRYPTGMTWDGFSFWICNSTGEYDYIFQVSPDGTLLSTISVPNQGDAQPTGLVFTQN